jgi:hypothetical protein
LYRVIPETGLIEDIPYFPWTSVDSHSNTGGDHSEMKEFLSKNGKIFQGGNAQMLHRLLQLKHPSYVTTDNNQDHIYADSILYVGDHIYADTIRSKRLGWRTCFIVEELNKEIALSKATEKQFEELCEKRKQQLLLENEQDSIYFTQLQLQQQLEDCQQQKKDVSQRRELQQEIDSLQHRSAVLKNETEAIRNEIFEGLGRYNRVHHPKWGTVRSQLMISFFY